jgi:hypothetical protein
MTLRTFANQLLMYVDYSIARHTLMHIHILLQLKTYFVMRTKATRSWVIN